MTLLPSNWLMTQLVVVIGPWVFGSAAAEAMQDETKDRIVVRGRIIGENGPERNRRIVVSGWEMGDEEFSPWRWSTTTDADGDFAWSLDPLERVLLCVRFENAPHLCSEVLDLPSTPGEVDLGDVMVPAGQPLTKLRVVDDEGKPIAGATVETELQLRGSLQRAYKMVGPYWSFQGLTGDDGTLSVFGVMHPEGKIRFRVEADGYSMRARTSPIRHEVVVQMQRLGTFHAAIRLPQDPEWDQVPIRAVLAPEFTVDQKPQIQTSLDGRWEFTDLFPGRYGLDLSVDGMSLAKIRNIVIYPNQVSTSARVDAVDLSRYRIAYLEVVAPEGVAVEGQDLGLYSPWVRCRRHPKDPWAYIRPFEATANTCRLRMLFEGDELEVRIDAKARLEHFVMREDMRVELRPPIPLTVQIIAEGLKLPDGVRLEGRIHRSGEDGVKTPVGQLYPNEANWSSTLELDPSGKGQVDLALDGRYTIDWVLTSGSTLARIGSEELNTIVDVAGEGEPPVVRVAWRGEQVKMMMQTAQILAEIGR